MTKLLIVEDDPVMRRLLARALEPLEVSVHYASDGLYALDALRCNPDYDLILTDINMPILDGRTFISLVRQESRFDALPIIIMSGVVGMSEIADLLDAGADRFISKPFKVEMVREEVTNLLSR